MGTFLFPSKQIKTGPFPTPFPSITWQIPLLLTRDLGDTMEQMGITGDAHNIILVAGGVDAINLSIRETLNIIQHPIHPNTIDNLTNTILTTNTLRIVTTLGRGGDHICSFL